jgi:hypothetical protein
MINSLKVNPCQLRKHVVDKTVPPLLPPYALNNSSSSSTSSSSNSSDATTSSDLLLTVIKIATTATEDTTGLQPLAHEFLELCLKKHDVRGDSATVEIFKTQQQQFLAHYYKHYAPWLVKPLQAVGAAQTAERSSDACAVLLTVLDLITNCVKQHGALMYNFTVEYSIGSCVVALMTSRRLEVQVSYCISIHYSCSSMLEVIAVQNTSHCRAALAHIYELLCMIITLISHYDCNALDAVT